MLSTYSYSSLNTYLQCPRRFKFAYFDRPEIPRYVSVEAYMGNAVHRVLNQLYQRAADGVLMPVEEMLSVYRAEWEKPERESIRVVKDYMTVDEYIELGEKMLREYYEQYQPFDQGRLLGSEMNLRFQLTNTPFKLTARIDRLWRREDGVIEVSDYKTGRFPQEGVRDDSFTMQMGLYELAVREKFPHWERVELAQYYLKTGEVLKREMDSAELDELAERIRQTILASIKAEEKDEFPTSESSLCDYCDYFRLCPAKRHKLLLDDEEAEEDDGNLLARKAGETAEKFIELKKQAGELKTELDTLKEDIVRMAKQLEVDKLSGESGEVVVRLNRVEKFVGKSKDPKGFAELNHLVRQLGMDEYLVLDSNAFMKEVYMKERLEPPQLEELKKFIIEREESRITVRRFKDIEEPD